MRDWILSSCRQGVTGRESSVVAAHIEIPAAKLAQFLNIGSDVLLVFFRIVGQDVATDCLDEANSLQGCLEMEDLTFHIARAHLFVGAERQFWL